MEIGGGEGWRRNTPLVGWKVWGGRNVLNWDVWICVLRAGLWLPFWLPCEMVVIGWEVYPYGYLNVFVPTLSKKTIHKHFFPKWAFLQKDDFSLLYVSSWEKSVTLNPVCAMSFVMNRPVEQFLSFLAVHANKPDSCCILDKEEKGVVGFICICCSSTQMF